GTEDGRWSRGWWSYGRICWAGRATSDWRILRGTFTILTSGSPDGCGWCNSNSGNGGRRPTERRGSGTYPTGALGKPRTSPDDGGGSPPPARRIPLCPRTTRRDCDVR